MKGGVAGVRQGNQETPPCSVLIVHMTRPNSHEAHPLASPRTSTQARRRVHDAYEAAIIPFGPAETTLQ